MKKNKMMRAAAGLLVSVLLTTCVISGTFAKYTTSADGSDAARVAKFGVEIIANGSMFSEHYNGKDSGNGIATAVTGSVDSSVANQKILAPGTKGEMVKMTLTGTPEVKVQVTYKGTVTLNGKWLAKQDKDAAESYYCPLKVTVGDVTLYGLDYTSEDDFKQDIEAKINATTTESYDAGTNLADKAGEALAISWEWEFEGTNGTAVNRTDYADTDLGNAAEKGNIEIKVTTTVTQVD